MRRLSPGAENGVASPCVIEPSGNNLSANAPNLAHRVGTCFKLRKSEQPLCEAACFGRQGFQESGEPVSAYFAAVELWPAGGARLTGAFPLQARLIRADMDPYTLYTLLTLASVGKAGVILLVAPQYPARITRAMHSWALGGLMTGMNFALFILAARALVPEPVALGGAVTLAIGGSLLVFVAVQELRERAYSKFALLGVFVLTAVSNVYTLYAGYDKLRISTNSAWAAAVFFMIASALLRPAPPSGRSIYRVTGVLALAISVVLAIRAVNPLILGAPIVHPMDENWVQQLTYSAMLVGNVLGSLCFGLIVAEELNAELHQLASFDSLTRIYNRRVFENLATDELLRARSKREPVSLLMIDIDHFKQVNDRHGHAAGDAALVRVAETMEESLRHRDLFCRYGGEEFGVLLPATTQEQAQRIADRLRLATMHAGFRYGEEAIPLTVSIGVTCIDRPPYDLSLLKHSADRALYHAKQTGRNRVAVV